MPFTNEVKNWFVVCFFCFLPWVFILGNLWDIFERGWKFVGVKEVEREEGMDK